MVGRLDPRCLSRTPSIGLFPLPLKPKRHVHLALVEYRPGRKQQVRFTKTREGTGGRCSLLVPSARRRLCSATLRVRSPSLSCSSGQWVCLSAGDCGTHQLAVYCFSLRGSETEQCTPPATGQMAPVFQGS